MTQTIQLTGDIHKDIRTLSDELDRLRGLSFMASMNDLAPLFLHYGVVKIGWDIGSEYDDGSSYYDVVENMFGYDAAGETVDIVVPVPDAPMFEQYKNYDDLYELLREHLEEDIHYLKESAYEFNQYHFLTKELS